MKKIIKIVFIAILWFSFLGNTTVLAQLKVEVINISGNYKTKKNIILRELKFAENDVIEESNIKKLIEDSKRNLLLTGLFNIVEIECKNNGTALKFDVIVQERWYLWLYPILEVADRNFDTYFFNKQWDRINYGLSLEKHNFRGRNELLHIKIRLGYKEQYSIYYNIPYVDLNKKHGLWFGIDYFRQKEMAYNIENYLYNYFNSDNYIYQNGFAQAGYQYRISYNLWIKARFSFNSFNVSDTILSLNPAYLENSPDLIAGTFALKLQFDNSDNKVYPVKGIKSYILIEQTQGFDKDFKQLLNIRYNFQIHNQYAYRQFFSLESEINYLDAGYDKIPFPLYQPLGYEQYLRGFDNYVFNPDLYAFVKTSIKYEFLPYKETTLPLISLTQFNKFHYRGFISAFLDFGYISEYGNALSAGLGMDIVFYYDRVFSTYIAWNNLNKKIGIFVQYKTPLIKQF
ncbi:MAG TPA: POTRA domain-containing protein [Bacteroidales bacterium]|nr:POTRA domain-containing protein [Bacteroidales bacterium]MDY0159856.1 POTRA domain-containing protein [Bacteroidales bacterium]HRW21064.1 POTRA domain-containing protein [Bacteroidales bacterium]HXK81525.1 POTRA domain-containing protein [Bacteroidales bacterium]